MFLDPNPNDVFFTEFRIVNIWLKTAIYLFVNKVILQQKKNICFLYIDVNSNNLLFE